MRTLYLAWQDKSKTRRWFPIGRLDADPVNGDYRFGYIAGAKVAHEVAGFEPLQAFPDFHTRYESGELFPLFQNRVMRPDRKDYHDYVSLLDLELHEPDPLSILEISGGTKRTDNLEVFPKIQTEPDGSFKTRFFLRGWRYINEHAINVVQELSSGQLLAVSVELNNPATGVAIQLQTLDYIIIGWAPRYIISDIIKGISENVNDLSAKVVKVNPAPAPKMERILIELKGKFPPGHKSMSGPDFKELWDEKNVFA